VEAEEVPQARSLPVAVEVGAEGVGRSLIRLVMAVEEGAAAAAAHNGGCPNLVASVEGVAGEEGVAGAEEEQPPSLSLPLHQFL
jgi:hypothetical protein